MGGLQGFAFRDPTVQAVHKDNVTFQHSSAVTSLSTADHGFWHEEPTLCRHFLQNSHRTLPRLRTAPARPVRSSEAAAGPLSPGSGGLTARGVCLRVMRLEALFFSSCPTFAALNTSFPPRPGGLL